MLTNTPKRPFADLLEKMNLVLDEPEAHNIKFRFQIHAKNLADFIARDDMPTPFSIAIHGEWGSGKTTLCKLVKKKLDSAKKTSAQKIYTLEFNAWEYERSDVFTALLFQIKKTFGNSNKTKFAKSLISFGADAVLRRTAGMSKKDMAQHFEDITEHICTLQKNLKDVIKNKLVIFVDDLDRCNVENTLSMLEGIKMFLNIENTVFVVAVDMTKIERAWVLRYNNSNSIGGDNIAMIEGRDHVEKMFQLKLSLPHKSSNSIRSYINGMTKLLKDEYMEFLIQTLPPNPRKIKLTLNLIYFILYNYNNVFSKTYLSENKYLNTLITWIIITNNHPTIANFVKSDPHSLIYAAVVCNKFKHVDKLRDQKNDIATILGMRYDTFTHDDLAAKSKYPKIEAWHILEQIMNHDPKAFDVLKHFGDRFDLPENFTIQERYQSELSSFQLILPDIIEKTLL